MTLRTGSDRLNIEISDADDQDNRARIDVRDLKAEDDLSVVAFDNAYGSYYEPGDMLNALDVNNDGWLGAKDVEAYDYDDITVHVGKNFLELDVLA